MSKISKLKQIDNRYQYTAFGFCRLLENQLSSQSTPHIILYLCLAYYYGEHFSKSDDAIEISENGITAIKTECVKNWKNLCYGNIWIDSSSDKIATWTLKLGGDCTKYRPMAYIYIISDDNHQDGDCHSTHAPNYGFNTFALECALRCDTLQPSAHRVNNEITHQHGDVPIKRGEVFQLMLNLKNETIGYKKINQAERILFERIEKRRDLDYKLAVSFYHNGLSATIIDFKIE